MPRRKHDSSGSQSTSSTDAPFVALAKLGYIGCPNVSRWRASSSLRRCPPPLLLPSHPPTPHSLLSQHRRRNPPPILSQPAPLQLKAKGRSPRLSLNVCPRRKHPQSFDSEFDSTDGATFTAAATTLKGCCCCDITVDRLYGLFTKPSLFNVSVLAR